ncbi:MAG: endonuclease/exonuclease/phosphatase family protein, partial [Rhodanobacteraceae bacterium]
GSDRRFDVARIADVIAETGADLVALQELESRAHGLHMLDELQRRSGYQAIAGSTLSSADVEFGNGVLSRCPVTTVRRIDLNFGRREPRGALDLDIDCSGTALRLVATHLGLRPAERRDQVQRLLASVRDAERPTVLIGDLNEWFFWGRPLRWLHAHFGESPACATFPSRYPLLALDRIWTAPRRALADIRVHASSLAKAASDHLPLVAQLDLAALHAAGQAGAGNRYALRVDAGRISPDCVDAAG